MFSQIFIDRPKLAMVISIVTIILGCLCLTYAPIAEYPEIAPPSLVVSGSYTGAGAEEVANSVATVMEEQMNGLEDLLYFSSTSTNTGRYSLELTFKSGTNTDIALVNVQNAARRAEVLLPKQVVDNGVKFYKRSSDILSVFNFSTDGTSLSLTELSNYIRTNVRDDLARIDGVSEVSIMGERNYSMRIWLDTIHMEALNIKTDDIRAAIKSQNTQAAAGSIGSEGSNKYLELKVNALGRLDTIEEFGNIIVKTGDGGKIVRLKDISRIELGSESYSNYSTFNGVDCVSIMIYRNDDANAIEVINRVNEHLQELKKNFPTGVEYNIAYDPTEYIRLSMKEITGTLILTLILVIVITYLFLQDWRATLIPALTIPVSLLGTFIFLIPLGYSINLLTMFALILVIGSLVDDAIVVVENTMRIIEEEKLPPKEAASKSMKQITGAIIATTLVVIAIYAPIGFYGGMVGTIYLQFAVTMCIALCLSTFNAMTLSPALCALLLRPSEPTKNPVFKVFNKALDKTKNGYLFVSQILIRRIFITILICLAVIWANKALYDRIPSSFLPAEDKGALMCAIELPPGASINRTLKAQDNFQKAVSALPGVKNILNFSGFSFVGGAGENMGASIIVLDDWSKRTTPDLQIGALHKKIQAIAQENPSARINVFQPPAIMGLGVTGGVSCMLMAVGNQTPAQLETALNKFLQALNSRPETLRAFSSFDARTPQLFLDIDRAKAEALKVPVDRIFENLQSKLASSYINDFNLRGYSFKVKIQSEADERSTIDDINQIKVKSNNGKMVPLCSFAEIRYMVGPRSITRFKQALAAKVNVQANTGVTSSKMMQVIEEIVQKELGQDYRIEWVEMSLQEKGNDGKILYLLLFAIIFGYLFLVGQYESWTVPLPVMLSLIFAMLGGFIGMKMMKLDFGIYAQLGMVMLIGLASKNAILMVEFSKQQQEAGATIKEAALDGARQRYRAVLMTAWSFVIGVYPMVVATGAGAGSRQAIGITTFYGMILATIVGIAFIPPLYAICQYVRNFFKRTKKLPKITEK